MAKALRLRGSGEEWTGQVRVSNPAAAQLGTITWCICDVMVILVTTGHWLRGLQTFVILREMKTQSQVEPVNHTT